MFSRYSTGSDAQKAQAMAAMKHDPLTLYPVTLRFAAALIGRAPVRTGDRALPVACWTPPDALRHLGVDWALDLQAAVADWDSESILVVDASQAPGFAAQALGQGLRAVFLPAEDPARNDLQGLIGRTGATLLTRCPEPQEYWTPSLPQSRGRDRPPFASRVG